MSTGPSTYVVWWGGNAEIKGEKLFAAATACGLVDEDGATQVLATIESGARAGHARPRGHDRTDRGGKDAEDPPPTLKSARASTFEISAIKWLWHNRFALGKLGILAGLPDEGKGQVLCGKDRMFSLVNDLDLLRQKVLRTAGTPQGGVWTHQMELKASWLVPDLRSRIIPGTTR